MTSKPVVVLIRRVVNERGVWVRHSAHQTNAEAERCWARQIRGRGVTAWTWWGPRAIAAQMLADPDFHPEIDADAATVTD